MRGILLKISREIWLGTLLFGIGLLIDKALLTFVLPKAFDGFAEIFEQMPFAKAMVSALLGTELGDQLTQRSMQTFLWVHPTVLSLFWAHEIVLCTRLPAGEIDRGTIDILLGWPVSRWAIYTAESIMWILTGIFLIFMGLTGYHLVVHTWPAELRPSSTEVTWIMLNLFCVYLAVGGIALLVSASSDRRGRAVGIVFGLVLSSFLLTFLSQFWIPAKKIAFLSVMEYYQPAEILNTGQPSGENMAILLGVAATSWILGGVVFSRRSICTV
jgi:ABC-type transport system involved in multi-copper enzyme maturation permease subunit